MAALTVKLTLTSSNISSNALNLSVSDVLSTTTPSVGLSRLTITTADDQELVDEAVSGVFYFYFKNLDATNFVILQTTASVQYARVGPGEFVFFAVNDGVGLEARADTASCNAEYAYWKKA
tara:strand:- start:391 stop:753 length:363 start_codon:yes stop_codon:yes gene_type:complete